MNSDQTAALMRNLVTAGASALGAWLVSKGVISTTAFTTLQGAIEALIGAVVVIGPIVASMLHAWQSQSTASKIASTVNAAPVKEVILHNTPANENLAAEIAHPDVKLAA